jgi:ABC-type uncharacterized transport system substrate-binding protein
MKSLWKILVALFIGFFLINVSALTLDHDKSPTSPRTNMGKKWRIALYEGGSHDNYYYYLAATVNGLMDLGWIDKTVLPEQKDINTREFWKWLSQNLKSEYIEFVGDAYYSANWDDHLREKLRTEIIDRLNKRKDIDLILAMGTWAGIDLANNKHSTPTLVMSTSDAVSVGIAKSIEDSGYDHLNARVDPARYERQVRLFHDIIGFKKLGVAYEDSVHGRSYAAIDLIEKVAKERGFEVARCFTQSDIPDQKIAGETVIKCFQELVKKVDAIYVTVQGGVNPETIPQLVKITNEYRIPTFSQGGSKGVRYGFLMSISRAGFKPVGLFHAATIAKIFNGAKPRQLNQLFEETPSVAINLKTAETVGVYLYADVLAAADEIYREIEQPK